MRKNFKYYHERISFLMQLYDEGWEGQRDLIVKNSPKIFNLLKEYQKFKKQDIALALSLENIIKREINFIPRIKD